jgi:hypothetical protein
MHQRYSCVRSRRKKEAAALPKELKIETEVLRGELQHLS